MRIPRKKLADGAPSGSVFQGTREASDFAEQRDMYVEGRNRLVEWLNRQLMGPLRGSENEHKLDMSPLDRFPVGVLSPAMSEDREDGERPGSADGGRSLDNHWSEDDEEGPRDGEPGGSQEKAVPFQRRRYVPPSSVGFSFCVRGHVRLRIEATGAAYSPTSPRGRGTEGRFENQFKRIQLEETPTLCAVDKSNRKHIWEGRAGVEVRVRPHEAGTILTVTLYNRQTWNRSKDRRKQIIDRVEKSVFESRLVCSVVHGEVVDYPRVDPKVLTDEERELELQYRGRRIFAVGHGAAVNWRVRTGEPSRVWSDFLPCAMTPIVSVEPRGDATVLEMKRLADSELPLGRLKAFVHEYRAWIQGRRDEANQLQDQWDREAASRICQRMKLALERMIRGVEFLEFETDAQVAFQIANRAMLQQMVKLKGEGAVPWRWRPFQLGFLLTTIESTIAEHDEHRDLLDLIWFQTGGGKTEAYLGLIAFLLVWRRLRYGKRGGGTAAVMRYTLRLLTRQQFQRAARLICALELVRRKEPERLGEEPFSVGIWLGKAVCPNRIDDAAKLVDEIRETTKVGGQNDKARDRLVISQCPWCAARFHGERGYEVVDRDFLFYCRNPECEFGQSDEPLPCRVVDESLYEHPPSLLIATIDKFARLAWEQRAGAFLGVGSSCRPPDLVLQDELHLISGPLGSIAGLYEAGIETAIRCSGGIKPKYIASTATIRMAKEQVRALYGRNVAVFPPPGLSCDDSWFGQVDRDRPGRLYVGYLAPLRYQQRSLAPLAASLLAAPLTVFRDDVHQEDLLEAWWTSVVYHGSLRDVGTSSSAFQSDVRSFGDRLMAEYMNERAGKPEEGSVGEPSVTRPDQVVNDRIEEELRCRFSETRIEQLWSRHSAEKIAEIFERLGEPRRSGRCLDAVLSTNMVSVGLDVSRLALMVVNGQPLTTGEYVQATSRVGRSEVPGIVVVNYFRHQARSLSHYESFRAYHESFYRFVEPSSVTPYTFQVQKRALPAVLVIALRHGCEELGPNKAAGLFDRRRTPVRKVVKELKRRVRMATAEKAHEVEEHIDRLLAEWDDEAVRCRTGSMRQSLYYHTQDRAYARLLYGPGDWSRSPGLWMVLHSMRNVEQSAALGVR